MGTTDLTGQVIADISVSLDGFITGPNDSVGNPLGDHGERLHQWAFDLSSWRARHGLAGGRGGSDADLLDEAFARTGAYVMGRRMFDAGVGPWGDRPPFAGPVFVVTHRAHEPLPKEGGTTFHFVTEGVGTALRRAHEAAEGRDVAIAGGAQIIQQVLAAGALDELQLHIVPLLLGSGVRLFAGPDTLPAPADIAMEPTRVVESHGVVHVRLSIGK